MRRLLLAAVAAPLFTACTLTPDYERPDLEVPPDYVQPKPSGESVANMEWWDLFQDEQLQLLIRIALEENKDLGIALRAAEAAGMALPVSQLVQTMEQELMAAGHGDDDVSALHRWSAQTGHGGTISTPNG